MNETAISYCPTEIANQLGKKIFTSRLNHGKGLLRVVESNTRMKWSSSGCLCSSCATVDFVCTDSDKSDTRLNSFRVWVDFSETGALSDRLKAKKLYQFAVSLREDTIPVIMGSRYSLEEMVSYFETELEKL